MIFKQNHTAYLYQEHDCAFIQPCIKQEVTHFRHSIFSYFCVFLLSQQKKNSKRICFWM